MAKIEICDHEIGNLFYCYGKLKQAWPCSELDVLWQFILRKLPEPKKDPEGEWMNWTSAVKEENASHERLDLYTPLGYEYRVQRRKVKEIKELDKQYPCTKCGKLRTKEEGGTTFSVCESCWDKMHPDCPMDEKSNEELVKEINKESVFELQGSWVRMFTKMLDIIDQKIERANKR